MDRPASRTEEVEDTVTLSREARSGSVESSQQPQEGRQEEAAKARAVAKYEAEQKAAEAQRDLLRVQVGVAMITPSFLDDR